MPLDEASIIGLAGVIVAAGVGGFGGIQYLKSLRERRSQWIHRLYNDFYVKSHLKAARDKLDSDVGKQGIERIIGLKNDSALSQQELNLLYSFTDYLNFFQFILYLKKISMIKDSDIADMFSYYVGLLRNSLAIKAYLKDYNYDILYDYLFEKGQ